ncbi:MAG TPA: hypothetical protein VFX16_10170 [Pseudonocardiaceae bacterium]|nr:hypothetical protein [Pseudonocardiaceae bacterium]
MRQSFARRHDRLATSITVILGTLLIVLPALAVITELAVPGTDPPQLAPASVGWVWTHLVLAAVLLVVGVGLLSRLLWAYFAALGLAISALLTGFLTIPDHVALSMALMSIKIAEIWALARELNVATVQVAPEPAEAPLLGIHGRRD